MAISNPDFVNYHNNICQTFVNGTDRVNQGRQILSYKVRPTNASVLFCIKY